VIISSRMSWMEHMLAYRKREIHKKMLVGRPGNSCSSVMGLKKRGCKDVNWIELAKDKVCWQN
jgi:hypothetical protein